MALQKAVRVAGTEAAGPGLGSVTTPLAGPQVN